MVNFVKDRGQWSHCLVIVSFAFTNHTASRGIFENFRTCVFVLMSTMLSGSSAGYARVYLPMEKKYVSLEVNKIKEFDVEKFDGSTQSRKKIFKCTRIFGGRHEKCQVLLVKGM